MGVWIETAVDKLGKAESVVTPCMGVWIETLAKGDLAIRETCHTLYGCVD